MRERVIVRHIICTLSGLLFLSVLSGQVRSPVKVSSRLEPSSGRAGEVIRVITTVEMEPTWHIYAVNRTSDGPISSKVTIAGEGVIDIVGMTAEPVPITNFDGGFNLETHYHEREVTFETPVTISRSLSPGDYSLSVTFLYQTCNSKVCYPPRTESFDLAFSVEAGEARLGKTLIVALKAFLSVNKVKKGSKVRIAVKPQITEGWHINSFQPVEEFLIPTKLTFKPIDGISFSEIEYPLHEMRIFPFSEEKMAVYTGTVSMLSTMMIGENIPAGYYTIQANLFYQACDDRQCLPPVYASVDIPIQVVESGTPVANINENIFESGLLRTPPEIVMEGETGNKISQLLVEKGWFVTFLIIFSFGLALNLTPCVYPLIPITVGFFVNQAEGRLSRSFFLAILYVLGMSLTYSFFGLMASLSGGMLGSALQSPVALIFIALVLVVLASSMFGAFEIRVPQKLASIGGAARQGYIGSVLMGLTVGIVAAPCIGPFVISLLIFVAEQGDPFLGFFMFFVLSLGLGLPFIFLGAFSGSVTKLPQSGMWMIWVRKVFGFVLIGLAFYFLEPLLPDSLFWGGLITTTFGAGIYLGWIDRSTSQGKLFPAVKKGIAFLFLALGIYFILPEKEIPSIKWLTYDDRLLIENINRGRPVMIDFYADWCIPCKELDKHTFTDDRVIEYSKQFLPLKADLTKEGSIQVQELRKKYRILGVPTIVFIDTTGNEREDLRLTGFADAEIFFDLMQSVFNSIISEEK